MKSKIVTALLTLVVICFAAITGCSGRPNANAAVSQTATVQRGNLSIDITAAGNLALSTTQDLAFDLFYAQGTVSRVNVQVGDTVTKGEVLATIDQTEWDNQLTALHDKVAAAQQSLLQAQNNLQSSNQTLLNTQQSEAADKLSILNAQISLNQAQSSLDAGISAIDYQAAEAALNRATTWYNYVVKRLQQGQDIEQWQLALETATDQLTVAQTNYDNALSGYNSQAITLKKRQVEAAKMQLAQAQAQLNKLPAAIAAAAADVQLKTSQVAAAQTSLTEARDALNQAQGKDPTIVAPFSGFVTAVNVKGGDYIYKGTVAVTIADPNKFEVDIVVGEANILKVRLGGPALIKLSALPGETFTGNVTFLSPTATIQSGVVNFKVTVAVNSTPSTAAPRPGGSANATVPGAPQAVQLKDGLTATVNIIVLQKNNVLLVPNAAITVKNGQETVEVLLPDGATQTKVIQTGETDYKNTEVISGLNEGDKVVIPQVATTGTTTPRPGGGIGIFGRGG